MSYPNYDEPFEDCTCSMLVLRLCDKVRDCPIHDVREPPEWVPADGKAMDERDDLEIVRRAALDTGCPECGGTGVQDSGAENPWGGAIMIPCGCVEEIRKENRDG